MLHKFFRKQFFSPSVLIAFFLVISFFLLANSQFFIPLEIQQKFSFNIFLAPQNFLFYLFVHVGVAHLLANVFLVLFFGKIVEGVVSKKHVFALFFGVGILSFALFNFFSPGTFGVGASGGSIALTAAAFVFSPKKSFVALLLVFVISMVLLFGYNFLQQTQSEQLVGLEQKTKLELGVAIKSNDSNAVRQKSQELQIISKAILQQEEHAKYEKEIQVANGVHFISAVLAIVYLFLLCKKETLAALKNTWFFLHGKHLKPF